MRKLLLVAGMVAVTAFPAMASAATRCEQHQADNRAAGTVIGAIAGGLLGNAVSSGGGKAGGTVIGALGGAVVGNMIARQNNTCPNGYDAYEGPPRDRAAYYGSESQEQAYYQQYGRHSDGYRRYQEDQARDARADAQYASYQGGPLPSNAYQGGGYQGGQRQSSLAYTGSSGGGTWQAANGQTCSWQDQPSQNNQGGMNHHWVQACQ